jgi:hypothetical protein
MPVTRSQAARWTRIPLAGGGQESLLSEVGAQYLLPLFTTAEACALRLVCREFLAAVSEQPWEDTQTVIKGSIAAWRACFPRARFANVREWDPDDAAETRANPVVDADFVHFEGLRELCMAGCRGVSDAAFVHLRDIHRLDISECSQVTDAAFAHLRGIHTLDMSFCSQAGITDAAFAHLHGIHTLCIGLCTQITDAAFVHLRGIHTLSMLMCSQPGITDAAFVHLRGIYELDMSHCNQAGITGATFEHLRGINMLLMVLCRRNCVRAAHALGLPYVAPFHY